MGVVTRWRAVLASALVTFGVGGAVLLTPATVGAVPPTNMIQNGNFGTINGTVPADDYLTVDAGSSTIANWIVVTPSLYGSSGGSVDVVSDGYWASEDGSNSIDLAGSTGAAGGIYQDITTTPYEEYSLSFYSAVNGDDPSNTAHTMGVSVNGTTVYSTAPAESTHTRSLNWVLNTVTFFATSAQSQIEFDDTTAGDTDYGPVLDDVSLTAVPDVITASPVTPPIVPQTVGTSFTVPVATFTDSYPSSTPSTFFAATVTWGDGGSNSTTDETGDVTITQSGSTYTVNGTHTYAADATYTVGVTITSNAGATASISPPDSIAVANAVQHCTAPNCNTNDNVNNENTQLNTQGTGTGFLELDTVSDSGTNTANCGDGFRHAPNVVQESNTFTPVGGTVAGTITAVNSFPIIDGTKGSGLEGLLFWVCFRSTAPFKNLLGQTTPAGSAGLLPVCNPLKVGSGPCINYITLTKQGNIVEEVTFPAGDPWVR
jgi:choice-of-anchor C domain-containing protein